jgi:hypothetical protein
MEVGRVKIYLVNHGCHSDYTVDGLFSTRKKAENFVKLRQPSSNVEKTWHDEYYIEEWEVDSGDKPAEYQHYHVSRSGTNEFYCRLEEEEIEESTYSYEKRIGIMFFSAEIRAKDYDHAIKIASEKLAQAKAEYEGIT